MAVSPTNNSQEKNIAPIVSSAPAKQNQHVDSSNISSLVTTFNAVTKLVQSLRGEAGEHKAASAQADQEANKDRGKGDTLLQITEGLMNVAKSFGLGKEQAKEKANESKVAFDDARAEIKKAREEEEQYLYAIDTANTNEVYGESLQNKIKAANDNNDMTVGIPGEEETPRLSNPSSASNNNNNVVSNPFNKGAHF